MASRALNHEEQSSYELSLTASTSNTTIQCAVCVQVREAMSLDWQADFVHRSSEMLDLRSGSGRERPAEAAHQR